MFLLIFWIVLIFAIIKLALAVSIGIIEILAAAVLIAILCKLIKSML